MSIGVSSTLKNWYNSGLNPQGPGLLLIGIFLITVFISLGLWACLNSVFHLELTLVGSICQEISPIILSSLFWWDPDF